MKPSCPFHAHRLVDIVYRLARVSGCHHKDAPRPRDAVEDGIVELVVAPEVLQRPLTEVDDAWLAHRLGIVEDVFEPQGIGGIGVFVVVGTVYEGDVLGHGVAHQAEIALVGQSPVVAVVAAARRDACRMGAVRLVEAVARVGVGQQRLAAAVVGPHIERTAHGVAREVVPQSLDAVGGGRGVVEGGVGEVKADVHHAHHDTCAGIGLGQRKPLVGGQRMYLEGHRVGERLCAASCLDARHARVERQGCQLVERHRGDEDIAEAR